MKILNIPQQLSCVSHSKSHKPWEYCQYRQFMNTEAKNSDHKVTFRENGRLTLNLHLRDKIFTSSCVKPIIHSIWHPFFLRNPLESHEEAIKVPSTDTSFEEETLIMVLNRLGFRKTTHRNYNIFLPCPLGTFSNYNLFTLEPNVEICIDCPPGMLYLIPKSIIETAGIPKKDSSLT